MEENLQLSLKKIREEVGLSIGDMATVIGLKKATYQCYENKTRNYPANVMQRAEAQLQRTREFWAGMDQRIDSRLKGKKIMSEVSHW